MRTASASIGGHEMFCRNQDGPKEKKTLLRVLYEASSSAAVWAQRRPPSPVTAQHYVSFWLRLLAGRKVFFLAFCLSHDTMERLAIDERFITCLIAICRYVFLVVPRGNKEFAAAPAAFDRATLELSRRFKLALFFGRRDRARMFPSNPSSGIWTSNNRRSRPRGKHSW